MRLGSHRVLSSESPSRGPRGTSPRMKNRQEPSRIVMRPARLTRVISRVRTLEFAGGIHGYVCGQATIWQKLRREVSKLARISAEGISAIRSFQRAGRHHVGQISRALTNRSSTPQGCQAPPTPFRGSWTRRQSTVHATPAIAGFIVQAIPDRRCHAGCSPSRSGSASRSKGFRYSCHPRSP